MKLAIAVAMLLVRKSETDSYINAFRLVLILAIFGIASVRLE